MNSERNSHCGSSRISDLNFNRWWTDSINGVHIYLHVESKDEETWHRVMCKQTDNPRLEMNNGKLFWLCDFKNSSEDTGS